MLSTRCGRKIGPPTDGEPEVVSVAWSGVGSDLPWNPIVPRARRRADNEPRKEGHHDRQQKG